MECPKPEDLIIRTTTSALRISAAWRNSLRHQTAPETGSIKAPATRLDTRQTRRNGSNSSGMKFGKKFLMTEQMKSCLGKYPVEITP
jgi:hypothetical protein